MTGIKIKGIRITGARLRPLLRLREAMFVCGKNQSERPKECMLCKWILIIIVFILYIIACVCIWEKYPHNFLDYTFWTIIAGFIAALSLAVIQIIFDRKTDEEKQIDYRAMKDEMGFMFPMVAGSGFLGLLLEDKIAKVEAKWVTIIVLCSVLGLSMYYRYLCEKIYRKELQEKEEHGKLLQEISAHLKELNTQEKRIDVEQGEVIKKTRYTTTTVIENLSKD